MNQKFEIFFKNIKFNNNKIKSEINNNCNGCNKILKTKLKQLICNICLKSVCKNCSKRNYKKYKICDNCFYKTINKKIEDEKNEFLKNKITLQFQLKKKLEDIDNLLKIKEKEKENLMKKFNIDYKVKIEENNYLNKELKSINSVYNSNKNKLNILQNSNDFKNNLFENYENDLKIINHEISLKLFNK